MSEARTRSDESLPLDSSKLVPRLGLALSLLLCVALGFAAYPGCIGIVACERPFHSHTLARADIARIVAALVEYAALHHGAYPDSLTALFESDAWSRSHPDTRSTLLDPWRAEYRYVPPPGLGASPLVWSIGVDAQDGTEDDIVSWKTLE